MVSLLKLAKITEEGVEFEDPHQPGSTMLLTPEKSIEAQNTIGADIIMMLDDVVSSVCTDMERIKEATYRSLRWADRCLAAHKKPDKQNLFGIVQGWLDEELRAFSLKEMIARNFPGYAIGGLSGGEAKTKFWRVVEQCTRPNTGLPSDKPRYLMGVGYTIDMVVCIALGVDMFDCVYPTRCGRFGTALVRSGQLRLQRAQFEFDASPISVDCKCSTCAGYSRSNLHKLKKTFVGACLVSVHNIHFYTTLMAEIRQAIIEGTFVPWIRKFLQQFFVAAKPTPCEHCPPRWVKEALDCIGITTDDIFDWSEGAKELPDMPFSDGIDC